MVEKVRKVSHAGARLKGGAGEREIKDRFIAAMKWIEQGFVIDGDPPSELVKRNSTQSDRGGHDLLGIPGLSIEVKRQEALSLNVWWQQCEAQARKYGGQPVLVYRRNHQPWRVRTLGSLTNGAIAVWAMVEVSLDDFATYYQQVYRGWLIDRGYAKRD